MKALFITLVLLILCTSLQASERVPGTKVSLDAPTGFVATKQFPGFTMESAGASIIVTEMPAPFSELSKSMTKVNMSTRGMELLERTEIDVAPGKAVLLRIRQQANGITFLKWMLAFGSETESVTLLAAYPEEMDEDLSAPLKQALLSVSWDAAAKVDFSEGLTFSVRESGDLKIAGKVGNLITMTRGGAKTQKDPSAPLLVAGSSISENWTVPGDKADYARERLIRGDVLSGGEVTSEKTVKFDGLSGYLMEADGKDRRTGVPMYSMQCMLFTSDGYYVLQGLVGAEEKEKYAKVFLTIMKSFKQAE